MGARDWADHIRNLRISAKKEHQEWNKWSCKLYLEGKVQKEQFLTKQAMKPISTLCINNGVYPLFTTPNHVALKPENQYHPAFLVGFGKT
jgi:hypothetical protein